MAEKDEEEAEKSVVPVIPKKSEDNIVEKDERKIGEKCAAKSSRKENAEKSPKAVVSCETPSKNERRLKERSEKGNIEPNIANGDSRGDPKEPRKIEDNKTNTRVIHTTEPLKIPFLLEISPKKLVVPPSEPLKVTVRNPTEDTQTLRCTFDSYYFLVDFKDAKSSGQHGVTPAAAYGCYELGPGESCSLTVRMTDREIDQSVDLKPLMDGTYNVRKPFAHLPRLKDRSNIIDIAFYNYDRPEGFLRFQYRKKEKRTNDGWAVRRKRLHLTDDIQKMIWLEDKKHAEEEKNEKATDPNPPVYMKFHRMKWMYYATQTYQKWRAEWGELLMNDEDGTHRVFPVQRDYAVEEFLKDKKNYNKTLGTEEDNIAFWVNAFVKEDIIRIKTIDGNEQKKCFLNQNVGFGKHDFTAETLEESIEKAEKFLEDKKKEYLKKIGFLSESERTQREKVAKKKKKNRKKIETQKAEDLKKEEETVQPVEQEEEVKEEKNEDKKKEDRKEEEFKKEPEFVQPVKQEEEKTIKKKEEKKEEKKKKKNPCCSIM